MPVEEFVKIVAPLKPRFIHHPRTKELIRNILIEFGCDLETTYQDVPRLRNATSDGYLTSGVGYAFHPHRDTWYSAPMSQLNWWLPIYEIESENSMAFHPVTGVKQFKTSRATSTTTSTTKQDGKTLLNILSQTLASNPVQPKHWN